MICKRRWGLSSAGRASARQTEGHGFKSRRLHSAPLSPTEGNGAVTQSRTSGDVAQSGRAGGSHPKGRGFKSPLLHAIPRDMAQLGRALGPGPRSRWFKSSYPDAAQRPRARRTADQLSAGCLVIDAQGNEAEQRPPVEGGPWGSGWSTRGRKDVTGGTTSGCSSAVERRLWEPVGGGSNPSIPTQEHGTLAQTAERRIENPQVGVSESPGLTTARHALRGSFSGPESAARRVALRPVSRLFARGRNSLPPEVPHNVAGTLGDLPQAGRTRLWTGGTSGPWGCDRMAEVPGFHPGYAGSTPVILSIRCPASPLWCWHGGSARSHPATASSGDTAGLLPRRVVQQGCAPPGSTPDIREGWLGTGTQCAANSIGRVADS